MNEQTLTIRPARLCDIPRVLELLRQVNNVHHDIRPDLFRKDRTKYEAEALAELLQREDVSIFVAADAATVYGYLFSFAREPEGPNLVPHKTLYIDDLCVDANARGQGVGRLLLEHAEAYARSIGCRDITLNVWQGNDSALRFYENNGFTPRSCTMQRNL